MMCRRNPFEEVRNMLVETPPRVNGKSNKHVSPNGKIGSGKTYANHLDWIHLVFLAYSGAHNSWNAWKHADGALFFLFVLAGILCVEFALWTLYKMWENGELLGKMLKVGKMFFIVAFFYASAGILAQAQSGGGWTAIYYSWVLPTSAPAMFLFASIIRQLDPIKRADINTNANAKMVLIDARQELIETQKDELKEKRGRA